jgi:DNA-binding transcriptional LysR family regulator
VAGFRRALADMSFYIEPDYSAQMCADLLSGTHDFAVMYTAKPHPDIHFTSVGDVGYVMISSYTNLVADLQPDSYVFAHFSPAFQKMHRQLFPQLSQAPMSVGQSATMSALLFAMGGAGYVLERTSKTMIDTGQFCAVDDAPLLRQPIYVATHLRHRISPLHRHLLRVVQRHLGEKSA